MVNPEVLPAPAFQRKDIRSRLAFSWRARDLSLDSVDGKHEGTFSRASAGGLVRGRGWLRNTDRLRAVGPHQDALPRFHLVKNADGIYVPSLLLEGQRTNDALRWDDFSDAAWTGVATVTTDDARAPDRSLTADKIEDDDGAATENKQQAVTVADDSVTRVVGLFVRKGSGLPVCGLDLAYRGGTTTLDYHLYVDPADGSLSAEGDLSGGTEGEDFDVWDWSDDWWFVWVAGANNGTGNTTLRLIFQPAAKAAGDVGGAVDASQTGSQHAWGAVVEGISGGAPFPSSPIPTVGSAVTRNAEELSWPFDLAPAESSFYARFVDLGTHQDADRGFVRVLQVGTVTDPDMFIHSRGAAAGWEITLDDASGNRVSSAVSPTASLLDEIEVVGRIHDDASVSILASVNGGAISEGAQSSAPGDGMPSAWSDTKLYAIKADTIPGFHGLLEMKVATGVKTMAEMRELL